MRSEVNHVMNLICNKCLILTFTSDHFEMASQEDFEGKHKSKNSEHVMLIGLLTEPNC